MIFDNGVEDQREIAWAKMPMQHKKKPNTEGLAKSFVSPLNIANGVLFDLFENTWVDSSKGKQLDGVGQIVGISRVLPEAVYLRFFGFASQPAGVGFGISRFRKRGEGYAVSYTLDDDSYKTLILAKIIKNNATGTVDQIIESARLLWATDNVTLQRTSAKNLTLHIGRVVSTSEPLYRLRENLLPVSASVNLTISSL